MMKAEPVTEVSVELADWNTDQHQLMDVRTQVFIEEQKVPAELEIDGMDAQCQHVKAVDSSGAVIATARLLPNAYIGRMCVLKPYRQRGIGGRMLCFLIDYARQTGVPALKLNAQTVAMTFYQQFGFVVDSDVFIEADIEHVHMTLTFAEYKKF